MKATGAAAIILASGLIWGGGGVARTTHAASASEQTPTAEEPCPAPPTSGRSGYARMRCDVRADGRLESP
jgi:hypothetical protein